MKVKESQSMCQNADETTHGTVCICHIDWKSIVSSVSQLRDKWKWNYNILCCIFLLLWLCLFQCISSWCGSDENKTVKSHVLRVGVFYIFIINWIICCHFTLKQATAAGKRSFTWKKPWAGPFCWFAARLRKIMGGIKDKGVKEHKKMRRTETNIKKCTH